MAKKRGQKREVKTKPQEEEPKEIENGENEDITEETPSKKRRTTEKISKSDTPVSASKSTTKTKAKAKVQENGDGDSESDEEDADYEVEKIVDVKNKGGKREFLVKWKNYSSEHNTWEPEANLACDELISEFLKNQEKAKTKPKGKAKEEEDHETKTKPKGKAKEEEVSETKTKSKGKAKEEGDDYEVQKILDVNYKSNNKKEFLIRWKNFSSKHDSWEPEENLACDELIAEFLAKEEKRAKTPRSSLREKPKKVSKYESPGNKRASRRIAGGGRKNYSENEDSDDE